MKKILIGLGVLVVIVAVGVFVFLGNLNDTAGADTGGDWQLAGKARAASSIARSGERKGLEEEAIREALQDQVTRWQERGDWTKLKCIELLFVRGWANKVVAEELDITEQQVANFKFDFIARMRNIIRKQGLSDEIFPELHEA